MDIHIIEYSGQWRTGVAKLWQDVLGSGTFWNEPDFVIESILAVAPELFLVATVSEQLAGTIIGGYDGHRGWLYNLAVADSNRGLGIGRALVREMEKRLQAKGAVKINLQVRTTNRSVAGFYQELGFEIEERISMGKVVGQEPK